ncbi:MAG TPA: cytidine deaminase [Candidatus Limnocylindria bacterium]|nr:cytidine deaminase [Candidatus Limnocylindria bacterium]
MTLSPGDDQLVKVAALARERAYAPYSRFKVGAALRTKRNKVHTGANVENASYGLTMCAERSAVFTAVASGDRDYEAIAIVTDAPTLTAPCGACRQVLVEFAPDLRVILASTRGERRATSLRELLPDPFTPKDLQAAT